MLDDITSEVNDIELNDVVKTNRRNKERIAARYTK